MDDEKNMATTSSATRTLTLKIKRYNPEIDEAPHWEQYRVEAEPHDRVLDVIQNVKWQQDETLSLRAVVLTGFAGRTRCGSTGSTAWRARSW